MTHSGDGTVYAMLHRRADVWERWARIYGGRRLIADFYRLWAAQARLEAEVFKALRAEQIVGWLNRRLAR